MLEHGRVAQDALAYAAEFVLHRGVDGVAVALAVQCRGEFVPFERELADLFRQRLALGEGVLDQAKLVDETAGQDEQPLRLDQADGLLLDRPELGMRMEDAFRQFLADPSCCGRSGSFRSRAR